MGKEQKRSNLGILRMVKQPEQQQAGFKFRTGTSAHRCA